LRHCNARLQIRSNTLKVLIVVCQAEKQETQGLRTRDRGEGSENGGSRHPRTWKIATLGTMDGADKGKWSAIC
jgi:hypothetical protein